MMLTYFAIFLLTLFLINLVNGDFFTISLPGVTASYADQYLCSAFKLSDVEPQATSGPLYVKKIEAYKVNANLTHHFSLFSCRSLSVPDTPFWSCHHIEDICGRHSGRAEFKYLSKRASQNQFETPDDIAFEYNGESNVAYLVIQAHFNHNTEEPTYGGFKFTYQRERPKYLAEINVVGATFKSVIPAGQADFKSYGNSRVDRPINVLAYRGHTHTLGTSTSLYKVSPDSEEVTLITKSDPRQPQTLEILKETVAIEEGDYIVVQCNYNTESKRYKTKFGTRNADEMCMGYLVIYTDSSIGPAPYKAHVGSQHHTINNLVKDL